MPHDVSLDDHVWFGRRRALDVFYDPANIDDGWKLALQQRGM
jgi:hypothetical protein